jgi:DNA-binding NarL/FixJ family response regulator
MNEKIKVAIVEDNGYFRMSLASIVPSNNSLCLYGLYASAEEALVKIPQHVPDVVMMDINLGHTSGIEAIQVLASQCRNTHFLVCTVEQDPDTIYRALSAGANGFILKHSSPKDVVEAIREIYLGGSPMTSSITRVVINRLRDLQCLGLPEAYSEKLSLREKEILQLLNKGKLNKEIAAELCISLETVRKHVYHIYRKLGVNNRIEMYQKVNGKAAI